MFCLHANMPCNGIRILLQYCTCWRQLKKTYGTDVGRKWMCVKRGHHTHVNNDRYKCLNKEGHFLYIPILSQTGKEAIITKST